MVILIIILTDEISIIISSEISVSYEISVYIVWQKHKQNVLTLTKLAYSFCFYLSI